MGGDVKEEALELALKMEQEGRKFYLRAGETSRNELAQKIFLSLADAELEHIEKIKRIYDSLKNSPKWPDAKPDFVKGKLVRTIFAEALKNLKQLVKGYTDELEAIKVGMDMENKGLLFYKDRIGQAGSTGEKVFYEALVAEERSHYMLLFDSYEYLADPQAYFTRKERHSLDGG